MSQIKINEIESVTTNGNLTITPNGTGAFEVAGEDSDGSLELNSVGNSNKVKIKSPPTSAAQNYTMILPTSNITANRFLGVDSIQSGTSGASAVGQLEFENITLADLTQLNANNFTSGTVAADRYSVTGSQGGGYQLIQKAEPSTSTAEITFSNLTEGMYKLMSSVIASDDMSHVLMSWLDSTGTAYSSILSKTLRVSGASDDTVHVNSGSLIYLRNAGGTGVGDSPMYNYFECEIGSGIPTSSNTKTNFMIARGFRRGDDDTGFNTFAAFPSNNTTDRIYGIKLTIDGDSTPTTFEPGTKILLYKYNED